MLVLDGLFCGGGGARLSRDDDWTLSCDDALSCSLDALRLSFDDFNPDRGAAGGGAAATVRLGGGGGAELATGAGRPAGTTGGAILGGAGGGPVPLLMVLCVVGGMALAGAGGGALIMGATLVGAGRLWEVATLADGIAGDRPGSVGGGPADGVSTSSMK